MPQRDEMGRWAPSLRGSFLITAVTLAAFGAIIVAPLEGIVEGARVVANYLVGIGVVVCVVAYLSGAIRH